MKSAFYDGTVIHTRTEEITHRFDVSLFMVYLELGELPEMFDGLPGWTCNQPGLARFDRSDHLGEESLALDEAVRRRVEEETGDRPEGPIRLLTQLRYFGYCFNPVSFYYCFDSGGDSLESVLAEVHNTPWGEEHTYVLPMNRAQRREDEFHFRFDKDFHVSPFLPMDAYYEMSVTRPGEDLSVRIDSYRDGNRMLRADLELTRRPFTGYNAYRELSRYPLMTLQVVGRIYYEALKLWWKGATFHSHPEGLQS